MSECWNFEVAIKLQNSAIPSCQLYIFSSVISLPALKSVCCFFISLLTSPHPSILPFLPTFLHPNHPPLLPPAPDPSLWAMWSFWEWLLLAGVGKIKKEWRLKRWWWWWGGFESLSRLLEPLLVQAKQEWQQDSAKEVSPLTEVNKSCKHAHIDKVAAHSVLKTAIWASNTHQAHTLLRRCFHPAMDSWASFGLANQSLSLYYN